MKNFYLLFAVFFLMLYSCSLLDDANTVSLDSSMSIDIPVAVNEISATALKSAASYTFSESGGSSLEDDDELQDYLHKIKSIDIENVTVYFYGLQAGQEIETVILTISGVGQVATLNNVTSANTMYNPTISSTLLKQVAKNLENTKQISATVSGNTNEAPMWFSISTEFDIKVKAEAL